MRGIPVALLKVDVDAVAPRVFFHNADDLRKEGILSAVGVISESCKDTVRAIVGYRQQPFDVRPSVEVGQHVGDGHAAFRDDTGARYLKRKETYLREAVSICGKCLIHSGIAHECPDHAFAAFQIIIAHWASPPSCIS